MDIRPGSISSSSQRGRPTMRETHYVVCIACKPPLCAHHVSVLNKYICKYVHLKVFETSLETRLFSLSTPTPERNRKLHDIDFDFLHCIFYAILGARTCDRVFKVYRRKFRHYFCRRQKRRNPIIERITIIRVPQYIYSVVFWRFSNLNDE